MRNFIKNFAKDESGATAIEYGLIAALMAVIIIAGIGFLRPGLIAAFTNVGAQMNTVPAA